MRKKWIGLLLLFSHCHTSKLGAQAQEVQQLLLNVEKLSQLKNILEDLKKGYQVVDEGYSKIKDISEGNFNMHQLFLDGLLQVSPLVKNYKKVQEIIQGQILLVKETGNGLRLFRTSGLLEDKERDYLDAVYKNLRKKSLEHLQMLSMVLTDGALRMSDDERLQRIDLLWKEVQNERVFLQNFNSETKILLLARKREASNNRQLKKLYAIKD